MIGQEPSTMNTNFDSEDECSAKDGRLIYQKVPSLREFTLVKLAFQLCLCGFRRLGKWSIRDPTEYTTSSIILKNTNKEETLYIYVVKYLLPHLQQPEVNSSMLRNRVHDVIVETEEWALYHDANIFHYDSHEIVIENHADEIVWKWDCKIDYRKTAINMLRNPELKELEKFKIASCYCLKDDMKEMWPFKFAHELDEEDTKPNTRMFYYWRDYFEYHNEEVADSKFISDKFVTRLNLENVHAVLYFWKRVHPDEQALVAMELIRRRGLKYQMELLSEMNVSQQLDVLLKIGGKILHNFAVEPRYLEYALLTWAHIRNSITQQQYVHILTDLLLARHRSERDMVADLTDFIDVMWNTTPPHLQSYCLDIKEDSVISLLTSSDRRLCVGIQFSMLVQILPQMDASNRRMLLNRIILRRESWEDCAVFEELIYVTKRPSLFETFVKLCLPSAEEQEIFKKKWISCDFIKRYSLDLIMKSKWKAFDKFLTIFRPNITDLPQYKMSLLSDMLSRKTWQYASSLAPYECFNLSIEDWKHFFVDLDETRLIDVLTTCNENIDFEMQFTLLVRILPKLEANTRCNLIDKIVSSQQTASLIFEKLITAYRRPSLLNEFVKMCFSNAEEEAEFKRKWLNVDVLKKYCVYLIGRAEIEYFENLSALRASLVDNNVECNPLSWKWRQKIEKSLDKRYNEVNEVIDCIVHDADEAVDFRKDLLRTEEALEIFDRWLNFPNCERIEGVRRVIEFFLSSEEHRKVVKNEIINFLHLTTLSNVFYYLNESQWNEFLCWLFEDERSLSKFKRSLDAHHMFSSIVWSMLYDVADDENNSRSYASIFDRFLRWAFESKEEANEFKMKEILEFDRLKAICNMLS